MLEYSKSRIMALIVAVLIVWIVFLCFRWNYRHSESDLSFDAGENTELSISTAGSSVIIGSGNSGKIEIHAERIRGFRDMSSGSVISLNAEESRIGKGIIRITLPESSLKSVSVSSASGDIDAYSVFGGSIKLSVASGDVKLHDSSAESVSVTSASGDISIMDTDGDSITISSASGDIEAIGIKCSEISMRSASGDIYLDPQHISGFTVSQTSGDTEIHLAEEPGRIAFSTLSGELTLNDEEVPSGIISGKGSISGNAKSTSGDLSVYY